VEQAALSKEIETADAWDEDAREVEDGASHGEEEPPALRKILTPN